MFALFDAYPELAQQLPRKQLCRLPTPVRHLQEFGQTLGHHGLYLKNDGLSGQLYGGNKIRKLEFLLADALQQGRSAVITTGGAGSNHALATAVYSHHLGLKPLLMLFAQPPNRHVQRNLLFDLASGAELNHVESVTQLEERIQQRAAAWQAARGQTPYLIPMGGSNALSAVGYVNAAFELQAQVTAGLLPAPDRIYLPLGTTGTAAGLILGLRAAGLPSRVCPVQVVGLELSFSGAQRTLALIRETNALLHDHCRRFPLYSFTEDDFSVIADQLGEGYGIPTPAGREAINLLTRTEGTTLEQTYSGKALAALVAAVSEGQVAGETLLFWDTYNAVDFSDSIAGIDYRKLPAPFQRYFT